MWAACALAAVFAAEVPAEVAVEPRPTAPILVFVAPGFDSALRGSDVIDATARLLGRVSGIEGLSPEQAGLALNALDRCSVEARFACAVRLIRDLPPSARSSGRAVLVLRRPSAGGDERLDLQILDVDAAADALTYATGDALEDAIFQHARALPPVMRGDVRDAEGLADRMEATVALALGGLVPPSDHGELWLRLACAPCEVALDGRALARVTGDELRLTQVPAGAHELTISRDDSARHYRVDVASDGRVELDARDFTGVSAAGVSRGVLLGGGGAAVATGAALIVLARSMTSGVVCLATDEAACPSIGPWTQVDGDAVRAAPRWDPVMLGGATLAGAGLSWAVTGLARDGVDPWWAVIAGVVGASAGLSVAMIGSAP